MMEWIERPPLPEDAPGVQLCPCCAQDFALPIGEIEMLEGDPSGDAYCTVWCMNCDWRRFMVISFEAGQRFEQWLGTSSDSMVELLEKIGTEILGEVTWPLMAAIQKDQVFASDFAKPPQ